MKILTITLTGSDEVLANTVNLIMKNPRIEITKFEYKDPVTHNRQPAKRNPHNFEYKICKHSGAKVLDYEAAFKRLNTTREEILNKSWPRHTPQWSLKCSLLRTAKNSF